MIDKQTDDEGGSPVESRRPGRTSETPERIDISQALGAPFRVTRDGVTRTIDPYEAMLRQHVRKSLVDRCVPSMKLVLDEAEKHKVIKEPPAPARGGVFVMPKGLPEEVERQIFDHRHERFERNNSMYDLCRLLLRHVTFERLLRCFNGR